MWFRSLGGEDPLEEEMASHSSVLAWRISQTEEPGWLQSMGFQRVGYDWAYTHTIHNLFNSLSRERGKFSVSVLSVLAQKSQKWSVFFSRRLSFPLLFFSILFLFLNSIIGFPLGYIISLKDNSLWTHASIWDYFAVQKLERSLLDCLKLSVTPVSSIEIAF